MSFLTFLIPVVGIGVVVLFIVAMIQQGKSEHGGFKQAFFTVVTLVMLSLWVSGVVAVIVPTLKQFVFTQAQSYTQRYDVPPSLFLSGTPASKIESGASVYTCADTCEFTADDKAQFASWKQQFKDWQKRQLTTTQRYRNDLVTPLSLLIVGLPLYFLFRRMMERGAAEELQTSKKAAPLRSLYYYFVAFSGLIMAVVAAGALINTTLRVALKAEDPNGIYSSSTPVASFSQGGLKSVIDCQSKCGFTDEDVQLVKTWQTENSKFEKISQSKGARIHDDLSTYLPLLLIGFPLFWYHFTRIRKETPSKPASATLTSAT